MKNVTELFNTVLNTLVNRLHNALLSQMTGTLLKGIDEKPDSLDEIRFSFVIFFILALHTTLATLFGGYL